MAERLPATLLAADAGRGRVLVAHGSHYAVVDVTGPGVVCRGDIAGLVAEPDTAAKRGQAQAVPHIRGAAFVPGTGQVAVGSDDKVLRLLDAGAGGAVAGQLAVPKRFSALRALRSGQLLFADKFGDVFALPAAEVPAGGGRLEENSGRLLLGHISTVTDVAVGAAETVVATADRDEKVRVSELPRAHNIVAFCLGHRASVMAAVFCDAPPHPRLLASGAADGTLRLWDWPSGTELAALTPAGPDDIVFPCDYSPEADLLAVLVEGRPNALFYTVGPDAATLVLAADIPLAAAPLCAVFLSGGAALIGLADGSVQAAAPPSVAPEALDAATKVAALLTDTAPTAASPEEAAQVLQQFAKTNLKRTVWSKDDEQQGGGNDEEEAVPEKIAKN